MLLFLHGMWGRADFWKPFIDYFSSRNFRCMALELKESMDLRKVSFADYVEKVKKIAGKDDVLIGHSMGGLVVQKVAEGKEIKGGVAICSAPPKGIKLSKKFLLSFLKYIPKVTMNKPFKPDFSSVKKFFMNCMKEEDALKAYERLEKDSAKVAYELALSKIDVDERKVKCPLLFIGGKYDKASPPYIIEKMAKKYNAEFIIYEGCHWIFEEWRVIAEHIQNFLLKLY